MTAKDTITLPREVVEYAIAALESSLVRAPGGTTRRERDSITALRTALAAEQPKPSEDIEALRRDAERYRLLRRGQHWSVVNGIGDALRAEELDALFDAAMQEGT